jgi:adenosylhomocysteinase
MESKIKDIKLWPKGKERTEWAAHQMPVLLGIRRRFQKDRPLKGILVGACLHVSAKTANLALALRDGGAEIFLAGSNPLSTQDDIAAYLAQEGVHIFAWRGETEMEYFANIEQVLAGKPQLLIDDGADLTIRYHAKGTTSVRGGTEETTTGVTRLRNMAQEGKLRFPVIAVNSALTKHLFDNRYGTGQSALDGVLRATNILLASSRIVVCGYGWVGRGIAWRAKGMGARVIVTEIDPIKSLEALMDGFEVMPIADAASLGDLFITATGNTQVIGKHALERLKDGAILANAGHFNVEIDLEALALLSASRRMVSEHIEEFVFADGRQTYLLGSGRLVNLTCGEGHPAGVMDLSFANQALCVEYLALGDTALESKIHPVPKAIDQMVARLKLESLGVHIDSLTEEQKTYLAHWE